VVDENAEVQKVLWLCEQAAPRLTSVWVFTPEKLSYVQSYPGKRETLISIYGTLDLTKDRDMDTTALLLSS